MLLAREEMSFDFGGAKLDPVRDRALLGWMFNQFLYGEVTGIQCGHWLYNAPSLGAARFLAKQALEEFQHIDNFLECLAILGESPKKPNRVVRFLATGMMPDTWEEHVFQEMMFGEGLVLMCFYGLIDTIDEPEIVAILERAVKQEARHVEFGETETMRLLAERPGLRRRLLGLSVVSLFAVRRLARHMQASLDPQHPVLRQLPAFLAKVVEASELRLQRAGLLEGPLSEVPGPVRAGWLLEVYGSKLVRAVLRLPLRLLPFLHRPERLTETYLEDRAVRDYLTRAESERRASAA